MSSSSSARPSVSSGGRRAANGCTSSRFRTGTTARPDVFTLAAHESLPPFPAGGIGSVAEGLAVTGASAVTLPFARESAVPGPTPDSFAYTRTLAHRNLFWVAVR